MPIPDLAAWDDVPGLIREAGERLRESPRAAGFRIGDSFLQVVSDDEALLEELEAVYGDCSAPAPPSGTPRMRCVATVLGGAPLLSLSFDAPRVPDPFETARAKYRLLRRPCYVEAPGPIAGWRQLVNRESGNRLLAASNGRTLLVNLDEAPPEFAVDCIVGVAQRAQTTVLFLHAASVGIGGAGALILAQSHGGKSTLALTLAGRGHAFLGDDLAAVRLATREVLPFPKSASVREGPLGRSLDDRLRACRHMPTAPGAGRTLVRVSELFPASQGGPLPLRFAFLLDGFADRASISTYRPVLEDVKRLRSVVTEATSTWGVSPGRDLTNYLTVVDLLSHLRCHLVQPGPPDETARLIEAAMEGSCS